MAGGALVSVLVLLGVWVVQPLARRWQDQEAAIAAQDIRLSQLRTLVNSQTAVRQSVAERQGARVAVHRHLLTGSTPALAASNLQALLQGYADSSRVNLDRIDLVAEPGAAGDHGMPAIPVRLSGQGDVYGLTSLLNRLQFGEKLLLIDELSVNPVGMVGSKPDLLVFSIRLHGVYSRD